MRHVFWAETPEGGVRPCDLDEATESLADIEGRRVALDQDESYRVSTVFLTIDHSHSGDPNAAPILYESMVFAGNGYSECDQRRYCTREDALRGHAELCREWLRRDPN